MRSSGSRTGSSRCSISPRGEEAMAKTRPTLACRTRQEWRDWLQAHHRTVSEIWLVFDKRHTGRSCVAYEDAVEEALCFGWIDSLVARLDDARYVRKFTPRTAESKWSAINRARYARVKARGLLTDAGIARPPTSRLAVPPEAPAAAIAAAKDPSALPAYIKKALKANATAWANFERLSPSYRRRYIGWIEYAKRQETREKRLQEVVAVLAAGRKLGLK
jgi:uncharacterized protein YdeI (YjbR/CyaY-like superfamily)